ncbi:Purine permease 3 [Nymphaea thermarum]|nr:Purine permease 3 [Nymphaea thermarum]
MADPRDSDTSHSVLQIESLETHKDATSDKEKEVVRESKKRWRLSSMRFKNGLAYWLLVSANYISLSVGNASATLLAKFYFMHGGSRRWVSTLIQSAGFPLLFIPWAIAYCLNPSSTYRPFSCFSPRVLLCTVLLGLLLGFDNFLFAWGISYIPVSISALLLSSQLAFTALFSRLIVKQPMNFPTLNCIFVLTFSSALVGSSGSHERPAGVSNFHYVLGVLCTIGAACFFGLYLPLLQLLNDYLREKKKVAMSFMQVLETQIVILAIATVFSCVGMLVGGDFGKLKTESEEFDLGQVKYWLCLVFGAVSWQMALVGIAGMTFLASSLVSGICVTALIPAGVLAPWVFFHEGLNSDKVFAAVMSMWGFSSYLFGEYKQKQKELNSKAKSGNSQS